MGTISNRILISSVNDGTTIHGSLRATKSLTQGWNGQAAVPDWTQQWLDPETQLRPNPFYHPVVYLALYNGSTQVSATSITRSWYYNGTLLTFDSSGFSTNTGMVGWFKAYNGDPDGAGVGVGTSPCLEICTNLAGSGNVDIDLIKISGSIEVGGAPVSFEAGIDITISEINSTGELGVLYFVNGKATVEGDSDSATIQAYFYNGGVMVTDGWACRWEVNGTPINASSSGNVELSQDGKSITIYGRYVTDIATVTCLFYNSATEIDTAHLAYTSVAVIDDVGDEEYLYIRYTVSTGAQSTNDGAPVSLHSGQSVTYKMWVAKSDDSNAAYSITEMKAQPHKANGDLMTYSGFTNAPLSNSAKYSDGWCDIKATTTTDNGTSVTGGVFTVTYDDTAAAGANISIIVKATLA